MYGPNSEWLGRVHQRHAVQDAKFAERHGLEIDEYREGALIAISTLVAKRELRMRCRDSSLVMFFETKTWPNVFVFRGERSDYGLDARRRVEERVLNVPPDCPPEQRPAYGYLAGTDEAALDFYGAIILHLRRPDIDPTVCCGDSFTTTCEADEPAFAASSWSSPGLECRHAETDCFGKTAIDEVVDPRPRYAEAHFYELRIRDIEYVTFRNGVSPSNELVRALDDHGTRFVL